MWSLNEYIKNLQEIVERDPENGTLPVIYSSDDEGNSYHLINCVPDLAQVNDLDSHYLEIEEVETPNCVIIN